MRIVRIRPWTVVLSLVVVGTLGATGVFFAARAIHRSDRDDAAGWRTAALASIERLVQARVQATLLAERLDRGRGALDPDLTALRREVQDVRGDLEGVRVPEITEAVAAHYLTGTAKLLLAVAALEEISLLPKDQAPGDQMRAAVRTRLRDAEIEIEAGATALELLECRVKLRTC